MWAAEVVGMLAPEILGGPGGEHGGKSEKPRHCRHISDVGDPQLVRSGSVEVAVDQVGRGPVILVPPGCCRATVPMTCGPLACSPSLAFSYLRSLSSSRMKNQLTKVPPGVPLPDVHRRSPARATHH